MMGHCDLDEIRSQSQFCAELMLRLNDKLHKEGESSWSGMANHTQSQDDIKRIRRELMSLSKMLNPWENA